jgi:hypothetical protein
VVMRSKVLSDRVARAQTAVEAMERYPSPNQVVEESGIRQERVPRAHRERGCWAEVSRPRNAVAGPRRCTKD